MYDFTWVCMTINLLYLNRVYFVAGYIHCVISNNAVYIGWNGGGGGLYLFVRILASLGLVCRAAAA